jgi:hypothetical protein
MAEYLESEAKLRGVSEKRSTRALKFDACCNSSWLSHEIQDVGR